MKQKSLIVKSGILISLLLLCMFFIGAHSTVKAATTRTTLLVGQSKQLRKKGATRWSSSRPNVASVTANGQVVALSKGTCKVTAYVKKKKQTWRITVAAPSLNREKHKVNVKQAFYLSLKKNSGFKFKWSVSDSTILKLKKASKYRYKVTGLRNGTAQVYVRSGSYEVVCTVMVGTGITDEEQEALRKKQESETANPTPGIQTLYMDGNVFKEMTWSRTDTAIYVSSISRYGQSAPLYIHKDGGDGLENIWAATNNGAVGVAGAQLSADAVSGTIAKACLWARAIADSPYHGYDYGHDYNGANLMYTFGQAKPNGLGTGDYCCSTIPLCAYYFAGVNVLGENLGGADAKYIPNSTKLFYEGALGEITFYENGQLTGARYLSNYEWRIFRACGFTDVVAEYNKDPKNFVFQAGDVVTANGHTQLVLTAGKRSGGEGVGAETVQAYTHDKVKSGAMPKGGDQSGNELGRAYGVRTSPAIMHIMRFTGAGVRLNTVGLI